MAATAMGFDRPMSAKLESADQLFSLFSDDEQLQSRIYHRGGSCSDVFLSLFINGLLRYSLL